MADLRRFHMPFMHSVLEPNGAEFQMETGPGTPNWAYIEDISPFFVHAVLAHEDAGFFIHRGFSMLHVRNALVRNLKERRYVVGASTITMQLVKNVFLHREKTLARKIQEVLLTWWIERVMEKRDILELYLNVIEYGPGVYGIRNGAQPLLQPLAVAALAGRVGVPVDDPAEPQALPLALRTRRAVAAVGGEPAPDARAHARARLVQPRGRRVRPVRGRPLQVRARGHASSRRARSRAAPRRCRTCAGSTRTRAAGTATPRRRVRAVRRADARAHAAISRADTAQPRRGAADSGVRGQGGAHDLRIEPFAGEDHIEDRLLAEFESFLSGRGRSPARRASAARELLLEALERVGDAESGWGRLSLAACALPRTGRDPCSGSRAAGRAGGARAAAFARGLQP